MFRADGLHQLTGPDLAALSPIGLRTVVDLRSADEVATAGTFPVDDHPVSYHHLSIMDRTWDPELARVAEQTATEFLHRAYATMLDDAAPRFAAAFALLADPDVLPAVFHCAAGKDRTGLLAALVLGALGVEHDAIVDDYALTQHSMARHLDRLRADPELAPLLEEIPTVFFAAEPEAMRLVLADLERHHGSVLGYVRAIGVPADAVDRLAVAVLEDSSGAASTRTSPGPAQHP